MGLEEFEKELAENKAKEERKKRERSRSRDRDSRHHRSKVCWSPEIALSKLTLCRIKIGSADIGTITRPVITAMTMMTEMITARINAPVIIGKYQKSAHDVRGESVNANETEKRQNARVGATKIGTNGLPQATTKTE
jgi:ribosomal protein S14